MHQIMSRAGVCYHGTTIRQVIDKAVRLVVDSGYTPREAYEAVPQLQERDETVLQHLRKQVRTARAKLDAPPAAKKQIAKKL